MGVKSIDEEDTSFPYGIAKIVLTLKKAMQSLQQELF